MERSTKVKIWKRRVRPTSEDGSAARMGDSFRYVACLAGVVMIASNSRSQPPKRGLASPTMVRLFDPRDDPDP
jgi:hypothetical protein